MVDPSQLELPVDQEVDDDDDSAIQSQVFLVINGNLCYVVVQLSVTFACHNHGGSLSGHLDSRHDTEVAEVAFILFGAHVREQL